MNEWVARISTDMPHSFVYIEDVPQAAALIGVREQALGKIWIAPHAPAFTQGERVTKICQSLNIEPQISDISPMMMQKMDLIEPEESASIEMLYEFTEPYVVDSSIFESTFGLQATPIDSGIKQTFDWNRNRLI